MNGTTIRCSRRTKTDAHALLTADHMPEELTRYLKGKAKAEEEPRSAVEEIQQLIGFDEVKQELKDLLSLGQMGTNPDMEDLLEDMNLHWVLRGNPGTRQDHGGGADRQGLQGDRPALPWAHREGDPRPTWWQSMWGRPP